MTESKFEQDEYSPTAQYDYLLLHLLRWRKPNDLYLSNPLFFLCWYSVMFFVLHCLVYQKYTSRSIFMLHRWTWSLYSLCNPRVLDIHRYGPSRAVWGQRDFFCAVISKVSNCDGMFVWLPTPWKWVSDFYAKSYRPTCPTQKKLLHLTRNNQMFITWCKEVLFKGQSFYFQRHG